MKSVVPSLLAAAAAALLAPAALGVGPTLQVCGPQVSVEELLRQINAARAAGHRCGGRAMGPASPLQWDAALYTAAQGHSLDMAKRNYFEHRSPEGVDVGARASAVRYPWKSVGENIAAGARSTPDVVQNWLESPGHCENIMNPAFNDVAVACVAQPGTQWGTYWTMVLGRK